MTFSLGAERELGDGTIGAEETVSVGG